MIRLLYSALWWVALPLVLLRLWWRGRHEPGYRQHVGERLGFYRQPGGPSPFIWVHAVSVGETRAVAPLVAALLERYPHHSILLTCMTATGRDTAAQLFGQHGSRVVQSFLPYDTNWMCARFLRHFRPVVCILMETEVWPSLLAQCRRFEVPVMLANARLSARSLRRGQRFACLLRPAAEAIDCVAAQSESDAERLREFGGRDVHVTGSLKFDLHIPREMIDLGLGWRRAVGGRKVLLCASTREGEEELILTALGRSGEAGWLTVIVPRHPQRFEQVAEMVHKRGLVMQRRSAIDIDARLDGVDVLLGDSMGEMIAWYALCDVAFIGGSLLPLGGQNLIEALALGKPVLTGRHTFNFEVIAEEAVLAGAACRVENGDDLMRQFTMLVENQEQYERMGAAAKAFAERHRGATERTLHLLAPLIAGQAR